MSHQRSSSNAPPETWSDSDDIVNSRKGRIVSSFRPAVGGTFVITCDLWRPSTQGTSPSPRMLESNNGGSFILDHLLDARDGRDINMNPNSAGLAHIRHVVERIGKLPYRFDIDVGEDGSFGQWTATYYPNIDNSSNPVLYTGCKSLPDKTDPGRVPMAIKCSEAPVNIEWTNVWISTTAQNSGHAGAVDVIAPEGYTSRWDQPENSEKYSGHTADKFRVEPGIEAPEYRLAQPASGAGIATHCRGSMVVYRTRLSARREAVGPGE
jgi:hypothetical protein